MSGLKFNPKPGNAISERIAMLNKAREEAEQRALEEERRKAEAAAPPPLPALPPVPPPPAPVPREPAIPPEEAFLYEEGSRFKFPHPLHFPRAPAFTLQERIYPSFVTAQSEKILQKVSTADPDLRRVVGVADRQRKCSVLHDIKTRDLKSGLRPVEREEKVFEQVLKVNPELTRMAPGLREADRVRKHSVLQDIRRMGAEDGQALSPLRYGRRRVGGEGGNAPPTPAIPLAPQVEPPPPPPPEPSPAPAGGKQPRNMFALPGLNTIPYESLQQQRKQAMEEEIRKAQEEEQVRKDLLAGGAGATSTTPSSPMVSRAAVALPVAGRIPVGLLPGGGVNAAPPPPPQIVANEDEDDEEDLEDDDDDLDEGEEDKDFKNWAATEGAALLQTPGGAELKVYNSKLEEIKERSRQRKIKSVARRAAANPMNVFNKAQGALQGQVVQPVLIPQATVPLSMPTGIKVRQPQPPLFPEGEDEKKGKKKNLENRYDEHMNFNPLAAALGPQS